MYNKLFLLFVGILFTRLSYGGILSADTTLDLASSPWHITSDITVPNGVTLTIEPGTILLFDQATGIVVQQGGRLLAEGNEQKRILLDSSPDSNSQWGGIEFSQSLEDNRLCYIDMKHGDQSSQIIYVNKSKLLIDHVVWNSTDIKILEVVNPSAIVRKSQFSAVANQEAIHGHGLTGDEYLIIQGNTFNTPSGYNDVIDFSNCKRPGPILQVLDNIFLGGGDDGLDLDGCDAHIEGNYFMNFKKDNGSSSTSNAIATGASNGHNSDITVVRNIFFDNDHAILLKEGAFLNAENNVFVNSSSAAINYSEYPFRSVAPGKGALIDGCIFWNNVAPFENQIAQSEIQNPEIMVNNSIIDSVQHNLGDGNLDVDPQFIDATGDFHLASSSPAIGMGPNGLDMGAYVTAGASISGEPDSISNTTQVLLKVGGPGITHYIYCIKDTAGPWSNEFAIDEAPQIVLTDLTDGQLYTVYVKGKNSANVWQSDPEYAISKTWKADAMYTNIDAHNPDLAKVYLLHQNFPNPFNLSTIITFEVPENSDITVIIYDLLGREVRSLAEGTYKAGIHNFGWNAQNNNGEYVSTGIYLLRVQANKDVFTKKILLTK